MLVDPSMEKMLPSVDCAYELAVLVSKRARQLVEGGQPMTGDKAANMVSLACREVAQGKVVRVKGDYNDKITVPKTKKAREMERQAKLAKEEAERAREAERAAQYENAKLLPEAPTKEEENTGAIDMDIIEVVNDLDDMSEEEMVAMEDEE